MIRRFVPVLLTIALAILLGGAILGCAGTPPAPVPEPPAPQALPPTAAPEPQPAAALPAPTPEPAPPPAPEPAPATPAFDPQSVSAEVKTAAMTDISAFIEDLNKIIQRKDYDAWLSHLTPEYVAYYSAPALLAQYSEYPVLKRQNIQLKTLKDYFVHLVYPSRQNDRVDDIEYVSENLVKAITVSPKGSRDILYILEKHGDTWKIGIGR